MLLLLLRDLKLTSFVRLDQGNLTVTLVSASGLKAADRGGTSDPYCVFRINKEKVYKSQTYKKQLAPVFKNESFTAPVVARNKAEFDVKIYDWDQIGANTLLAEGPIPIADLESFAMREVDVPLRGGSIKLRLKWEPQLLARKREGTSLLGSTTRILTGGTGLAGDVVGYGVGAGGKVLTGGTRMVGGAIGGGTKVVGGAIGGGIGAIGGGIGAIGRGFGKIGGHGKKTSAEIPVVAVNGTEELSDSQVASPVASPVNSQHLAGINTAEHQPDMTHRESASVLSSTGSVGSPRSVFEDRESKYTAMFIF